MPKTVIDPKELDAIYEGLCTEVAVEAEFTTELVGGVPADDDRLRGFCKHHLKLEGEELEQALARIKDEEIGEHDPTQPTDEVKEKESYGVNVIRRDEHGPWLGTWMIKACIKCAASRMGIFVAKRGSKGDMAETGQLLAAGMSAQSEARDRVHLYTPGKEPMFTSFKEFMGSVSTPSGRHSIKHHSEIAPVGSRFAFTFRFPTAKVNVNDVKMILSVIGEIGLGSVKALERGKFKILSAEVNEPKKTKKEKK